MKLLVHAPNVHSGGGRALLHMLLEAATNRRDIAFVLDERLDLPSSVRESLVLRRVRPTLAARLLAEFNLPSLAKGFTQVLRFGNLPPLTRLQSKTSVFLQNRYLVESADIYDFPQSVRWRLWMERLWLKRWIGNADRVIVQTPTMQRLVRQRLGIDSLVLPFWRSGSPDCRIKADAVQRANGKRFVYLASGEPHKNHRALVAAWARLSTWGMRPTLVLTLDSTRDSVLLNEIEQLQSLHNLSIENRPARTTEEIAPLVREADALLFASRLESFGLPLLEARDAGLPVIAAEIDVVRDLLDPEQTFDPNSSDSIARAVLRFLDAGKCRSAVVDPGTFLEIVCA